MNKIRCQTRCHMVRRAHVECYAGCLRVPSQRSHERLQYNRREERSGLRCTSSRPARFHRSAPRMRPRIRATRASSPTSEMPRIGGRYFNREKSGDVAPRTLGSYRFVPATYPSRLRRFFSRNSSDRPPASDSRGALQSLNARGESAYPNTPDPRRYCLASATSSTTFASRSVPNTLVLALIHSCGAIHSLRPCNRRSCGPFRCT